MNIESVGQLTRQDAATGVLLVSVFRLEPKRGEGKSKGATDKAGRSDNFLKCSKEKGAKPADKAG